jgi:broad specificity phosphatase PhoE
MIRGPGAGPRLVLVRHGETEWSREGRHTSRTDLPLTQTGRATAESLLPILAGEKFALVLTSPLRRAGDTAARAGFPDAEVCEDLREWDYGDDEGRTSAEITEDRPGWSVWTSGPKNGEPLEQVAERADRVIDRALHAGGDVLLFAHGHILRILTARWLQMDAVEGKRFFLATGAPCGLGWEHDYRVLEGWNCRAD